jgi:hypothetical protein
VTLGLAFCFVAQVLNDEHYAEEDYRQEYGDNQ